MPRIRVFALALLGALLAFGLPARAAAQVLYGSLVVEVRDQSGSAVPGAEVTITQTETNWTRSGTSNELGTVSFSNVPLGTFSVRTTLGRLQGIGHDRCQGDSGRHHARANRADDRRAGGNADGDRQQRRSADRARRRANRNQLGPAAEPAGAAGAQLPEHVRDGARHLAAGKHALGGRQPGARSRLQFQRDDAERERDPHRRRDLEQPVAAARRRVRAGARSDRDGQRRDELVRRRPRSVGRHVGATSSSRAAPISSAGPGSTTSTTST